jgi:hypothetical protein
LVGEDGDQQPSCERGGAAAIVREMQSLTMRIQRRNYLLAILVKCPDEKRPHSTTREIGDE